MAGKCQALGSNRRRACPPGMECPPRADAVGGGRTPPLRDYAWKEWSGMLSGFYAKRWELFFRRQREALEANRPFDEHACNEELLTLEDQWAGQTERYPTKPTGDSDQLAVRFFEKYMQPGTVLAKSDSPGDVPLVCEVAVNSRRPAEAPRLSSVCFSSRWIRPKAANDPWNTFTAAAAFHATDFVWIYTLDRRAVDRLKQMGGKVYLAINSRQPDEVGKDERLRGRILDLDGNRVTAPWMRSGKGNFWGCANSPEYRQIYFAYAAKALAAGADGLQMDDPLMNAASRQLGRLLLSPLHGRIPPLAQDTRHAADLAKVRIDDLDHFDYREYLKSRHVPLGDAFAKYDGGPLKQLFAAFQAESVGLSSEMSAPGSTPLPAGTSSSPATTTAVIGNSPTTCSKWERLNCPNGMRTPRRFTSGSPMPAGMARPKSSPWCPKRSMTRRSPRRAGRRHVLRLRRTSARAVGRLHAQRPSTLLRQAGAICRPVQVRPRLLAIDRRLRRRRLRGARTHGRQVLDLPPPISITAADVAVIVRAVPGRPEAPVVLHLVDWRPAGQPITVRLVFRRFCRHGSLPAELLRPGRPALRLDGHTSDNHLSLEIPPLDPWGIVVLRPPAGN